MDIQKVSFYEGKFRIVPNKLKTYTAEMEVVTFQKKHEDTALLPLKTSHQYSQVSDMHLQFSASQWVPNRYGKSLSYDFHISATPRPFPTAVASDCGWNQTSIKTNKTPKNLPKINTSQKTVHRKVETNWSGQQLFYSDISNTGKEESLQPARQQEQKSNHPRNNRISRILPTILSCPQNTAPFT